MIFYGENKNNKIEIKNSSVFFKYIDNSTYNTENTVQMFTDGQKSSLMENNTISNLKFEFIRNNSNMVSLVSNTGGKNTGLKTELTSFNIRNDYSTDLKSQELWNAFFIKSQFDSITRLNSNFIKQINASSLIETKNFYLTSTSNPNNKTKLPADNSFVIGGMQKIGSWTSEDPTQDENQKIFIHNVDVNNTTKIQIGGKNSALSNRKILFQSYGTSGNYTNPTIDELEEFRINANIFHLSSTENDHGLKIEPNETNATISGVNKPLLLTTSDNSEVKIGNIQQNLKIKGIPFDERIEIYTNKDLLFYTTSERNIQLLTTGNSEIKLDSPITRIGFSDVNRNLIITSPSTNNINVITEAVNLNITSGFNIYLTGRTYSIGDKHILQRNTQLGTSKIDFRIGESGINAEIYGFNGDTVGSNYNNASIHFSHTDDRVALSYAGFRTNSFKIFGGVSTGAIFETSCNTDASNPKINLNGEINFRNNDIFLDLDKTKKISLVENKIQIDGEMNFLSTINFQRKINFNFSSAIDGNGIFQFINEGTTVGNFNFYDTTVHYHQFFLFSAPQTNIKFSVRRLLMESQFVLNPYGFEPPASGLDPSGNPAQRGEICTDDVAIYVYTSTGWKRSVLNHY